MELAILMVFFIGGLVFIRLEHRGRRKFRLPSIKARRTARKIIPFDQSSAQSLPEFIVLQGSAYIVDGDTLVIGKTQIRLFGIDAPEMNHPYGKTAKWALVRLCKGKSVRAEIVEKDAYGRTVARCTLPDGTDLSAEMVKLGMAIDWPKFSGGLYRHFETPDARRKLWLADARQRGRMDIWEKFDANRNNHQAAP